MAPYHFQRYVRRIEAFDHLRVAEAFAQAVAEIRALIGWLLDQGRSSVALFVFSLSSLFRISSFGFRISHVKNHH